MNVLHLGRNGSCEKERDRNARKIDIAYNTIQYHTIQPNTIPSARVRRGSLCTVCTRGVCHRCGTLPFSSRASHSQAASAHSPTKYKSATQYNTIQYNYSSHKGLQQVKLTNYTLLYSDIELLGHSLTHSLTHFIELDLRLCVRLFDCLNSRAVIFFQESVELRSILLLCMCVCIDARPLSR